VILREGGWTKSTTGAGLLVDEQAAKKMHPIKILNTLNTEITQQALQTQERGGSRVQDFDATLYYVFAYIPEGVFALILRMIVKWRTFL